MDFFQNYRKTRRKNSMKNNLIIIESGQLNTYALDDKRVWKIGRPCKNNSLDIKLYSMTISRQHGTFENMDGIWFYIDNYGKNGTVCNGKRMKSGLNGSIKPKLLEHGDIFVFGGGEEARINGQTVWALFSTKEYNTPWNIVDTKGYTILTFSDGEKIDSYEKPVKGMVVEQQKGIGIYMGNITYVSGDLQVQGG